MTRQLYLLTKSAVFISLDASDGRGEARYLLSVFCASMSFFRASYSTRLSSVTYLIQTSVSSLNGGFGMY